MKSSAEELLEALTILNSIDHESPLEGAANESKIVSDLFHNVNYELENGWRTTSTLFFKINQNREFMINYLKMELLCYFLFLPHILSLQKYG